jgi:hypothetical protein
MTKQIQETVAQRRAYVDEIRSSFYPDHPEKQGKESFRRYSSFSEEQEGEMKYSSLGIRTVIAILIFAVYIYCDQRQITFHQYQTRDVLKQIEWNPLPTEELEDMIKISLKSKA